MIPSSRRREPTLLALKFVGRVMTWDWIARSLVSFFHALLTEDLPQDVFPLRGDLSDWIEGVGKSPFAALSSRGSGWGNFKGLWNCCQLLWNLRDRVRAKKFVYQVEKRLPAKDLAELEDCWRVQDLVALRSRCLTILERTKPTRRFDVRKCFEGLRATQVVFRCLALYKTDPIDLIERARRGDRDAALLLIKLDRLFLTDPCTREVLRKAALECDSGFSERLPAALDYKAEFNRRHAYQVYFYCLFALGIEIPKIFELQSILDPEGSEFPGEYAFERFFERRRKDLAFRPVASDS